MLVVLLELPSSSPGDSPQAMGNVASVLKMLVVVIAVGVLAMLVVVFVVVMLIIVAVIVVMIVVVVAVTVVVFVVSMLMVVMFEFVVVVVASEVLVLSAVESMLASKTLEELMLVTVALASAVDTDTLSACAGPSAAQEMAQQRATLLREAGHRGHRTATVAI